MTATTKNRPYLFKNTFNPQIHMAFKFNPARRPDSDPNTSGAFAEAESMTDWSTPAEPEPAVAQPEGNYFGSPEPASPFTPVAAAPVSGTSTRNVLNSDVSVVGELRFTDDLLIDGSVEGEITSDGVLTVGTNAVIQAGSKNKVAIRTKSVIVHGKVTGDIEVTDRVELAATAELVGDITAARIAIQEGAVFIGNCQVGASSVRSAVPAPKKVGKAPAKPQPNLLD